MGWSAARERWAGPSSGRKSSSLRPTTPMWLTAFRRGRSPIPAAPRWKPPPIRRARAICSSSPTVPAATPLPRPTTSTRRTSPNCGPWKSSFRSMPANRRKIPRHRPRRGHPPKPTPPPPRRRPPPPSRLPPGWDELEAFAKKRAGEVLSRGTVYANLNVKRANAVSTVRVNEEVLTSILKVAGVLAGKIDAVAPSIDGLLAIKGVIEVVEPESNEAEDQAAKAATAAAFDQALLDLVAMRQREGVTLGQILSLRMDEIDRLARKAEAAPGRKPEAIRARLAQQVAALLKSSNRFHADRLNQEAR